MFGSSKNSTGAGPSATLRSGIERAKAERAPDQPAAVADDLASEPTTELTATKAAVAKNGFTFPEKQKAKPTPASDGAAHLYVGANIRLKGEITGCDMMRVEGTFEGTAQARQLILCPGGYILGTAVIDDADIEGTFEGTLQVRGRLFLRTKGRIRGIFSYGQLEIERGGTVEGKIVPFQAKPAEPTAKPVEPVLPKPASIASATTPASPPLAARPVQAQSPRPPVVQPPVQQEPVSGLSGSRPASVE